MESRSAGALDQAFAETALPPQPHFDSLHGAIINVMIVPQEVQEAVQREHPQLGQLGMARRARLAANAKPGVFAFNDQREAYEREWTDANYAVLTEVLATLPVNWRHYIKKRIFAALGELPAHQRRGDGSEVRRAFDLAVAEFPQLSQAQAAE